MTTTTITSGRAEAHAIRWHDAARPGEYVVTVCAGPGESDEWTYWHDVPGFDHEHTFAFMQNYRAIVDDFGRLVRVK